MVNAEKQKISSGLLFTKLLFIAGLLLFLYSLGDYKKMETITLVSYLFLVVLLLLALIYFLTRPALYCDEKNLYVLSNNKQEIQIPLADISAIHLSIIGFPGRSYKIKYQANYKKRSVRLFP